MDVLIILFVFVFPLVALIVSMYCLFYIFSIRRVFSKFSARHRQTGKEVTNE